MNNSAHSTKDYLCVVKRIPGESVPDMWLRATRIATGYYSVTFAASHRPDRLVGLEMNGRIVTIYPSQISECKTL